MPAETLPTHTFTVISFHPDQGQSWATLTIGLGEVALASLSGKPLSTHRRGPVTVVTARFAPPWWRIAVILHGDILGGEIGSWGAGLSGLGHAGQVRDAIESAGFEIVDRQTRFWRFPRSSFRRRPA